MLALVGIFGLFFVIQKLMNVIRMEKNYLCPNINTSVMIRKLFFLILFAIPFVVDAQDKILMMSGHVIEGKITDKNLDYLTVDIDNKGKARTFEEEIYRIFSYTQDGEEFMVYKRDTTVGNYLSVDEMGNFIKGAQDAMENYNGKWALYAGGGVGLVGGYLLGDSFVALAIPLVYSVLTTIHHIKPNEQRTLHSKLIDDPAYRAGFLKNTKTTRIFQALKGSFLGTAIGVATYQLTDD